MCISGYYVGSLPRVPALNNHDESPELANGKTITGVDIIPAVISILPELLNFLCPD